MKALELVDYSKFEYKDVAAPEVGEDDVLIKVQAAGICGSDIHGQDGTSGRRIPPVIMGHEASGDVFAVGDQVRNVAVGDRVTFDSTIFCGECFYCRRGEINFCEGRRVFGVSADEYKQDGAFAEYVAVHARGVYSLPKAMSYEHGAMIEPLSIAVHATRITPHEPADTAIVVGSGVIGLLLVQVLRAIGFGSVIAVDIDDRKLEKARELGADHTVNTTRQELWSTVDTVTSGRGAACSFDAVGTQPAFDSAVSVVRRGGTVTVIGNLKPLVQVPLQHIVTRQIRVQGSNASAGEYPACLELARRGVIDLGALISAVAPLSEGAEWFRRLYSNEESLIKVILKPNG
jgi:L-iditol 2-dehydrogenase